MAEQTIQVSEQELERLVLTRVMRLNATIQGIVLGLVLGGIILVATLWLVIKGGPVVGPHLGLLGQFFIGYEVTLPGSVIGFLYGFAVGFVIGFLVAKLYNWLADLREYGARAEARAAEAVHHTTTLLRTGVQLRQNELSEAHASGQGQEHIRHAGSD